MTKSELASAIHKVKTETRDALQTIYDELNQGQQKKVLRNETVAALFERYGVET